MRRFWTEKRDPRFLLSVPLCIAITLLVFTRPASTQAIDGDKIDYTEYPGWSDLRGCVKCALQTCGNNIFVELQCETNKCMCRPSIMGAGIPRLESFVKQVCSNLDDVSTAVSMYTAYCSDKGYTEIVKPTILESSGAFTVTAYVTATVTVTQTEVGSVAHATRAPPIGIYTVLFLLTSGVPLAIPLVWMYRQQRLRPAV